MKKNEIKIEGTEFVVESGMDLTARKKLCNSIMQNVINIGNKTMALIPIELLAIKPYQRKRQKHLSHIANNWDDSMCGVLIVSYNEDEGCFNIMDGQHRAWAAQRCGKEYLVCEIYTKLTISEEAKRFTRQIEDDRKLSPFDIFNAHQYIDEKDDTVISKIDKEIKSICDEYGILVIKSKAVNCLRSVTLTRVVVKRGGGNALRYAFDVIQKSGWGRFADAYSGELLCELGNIYMNNKGNSSIKKTLIDFFKNSSYKELVALGNNNYPTLDRRKRLHSILQDIISNSKKTQKDLKAV